MKETFEITDFGSKVFDPEKTGTKITSHSREQIESDLNAMTPVSETEGYGPFCRLFFFENWTDANVGCVPVSEENSHMLRTGYKARQESELPILVRWIEGITAPAAKFLCVVCYDKEQMKKEGTEIESDWGVVAFLGQDYSSEQPMVPATILRNALGIDEGGSGHKLDKEDYMRSVEFWENNVIVQNESTLK